VVAPPGEHEEEVDVLAGKVIDDEAEVARDGQAPGGGLCDQEAARLVVDVWADLLVWAVKVVPLQVCVGQGERRPRDDHLGQVVIVLLNDVAYRRKVLDRHGHASNPSPKMRHDGLRRGVFGTLSGRVSRTELARSYGRPMCRR